ncbi:MAG: G5 domain-containing protein, partial [Clostridia bacterium]|nr:G5 domain-containing protein [Clostridia bacterium]
MNNRRINNSKIVKKQKIRKFNEFQKSAVALAAASFALTLSSCEDMAQNAQTTQQRTQKEPSQTQSTAQEETYASTTLPFLPPPDIFTDGGILDAPDGTEPPATEPPATEPPATEPPVTEPAPEPVVEVRQSIHFEKIPYSTFYAKDPNMYDDESVVTTKGKEGTVKITVYSTYTDGVLTSSRSERETVSFSQACVITVGTKPSVTTEEKTVTETVEKYSTIYEECDTMDVGTTKVKTEGKDSVATRTYRYTYKRGELTGRELISESISERVDEVILVGTKEPVKDTSFGMPFIDAAHGGVD